MQDISDLELARVCGGFLGGYLDWLTQSATAPDDPFHGINIGTMSRRRRLIDDAKAKCAKEADPAPAAQEACLVRSGVRGPGFPRE